MSFTVAIKGPQGIVLAAESREITFELGKEYFTYDGFQKLYALPPPHSSVGILLYGEWPRAFGPLPAAIAEMAARLPARRLPVAEYAEHMAEVLTSSPIPFSATVLVAGYDEGEPDGRVYQISVPNHPQPTEHHAGTVGLTYGGMRDAVDRVLYGEGHVLPLHLSTMPLNESVDLARFLIDLTVGALRFGGEYMTQGTGGPVDIAAITADGGFQWVQRKSTTERVDVMDRQVAAKPLAVAIETPADINLPSTYTVVGRNE